MTLAIDRRVKEREKQIFHTNRQTVFRIKVSPRRENKVVSKATLSRRQANKNGDTKTNICIRKLLTSRLSLNFSRAILK